MDESPPYLLDTNILFQYVRDAPLAEWLHDTYSFDEPAVRRVISVGELRSLALQFGWGKARLARMEELLDRALAVPVEYQGVIEAYATIYAHCRREGTPIGENDTWIAATAHATGACLLTTDTDFRVLDPAFLNHHWIDPAAHR